MTHTTSASETSCQSKTENSQMGHERSSGPMRSARWYVLTSCLAIVLIATSACSFGGAQQHSGLENSSATSQSVIATNDQKPVPFKSFVVEFETKDSEFQVKGNFSLGTESNGINLASDRVDLKIGQYTIVIPPGSFRLNERGKMKHTTQADPLTWTLVIQDLGNGKFDFKAKTEGARDIGQLKPEDVVLTIGDDTGAAKGLSG